MNVGLLNTRIIIEKNDVVTDTVGNHRNTWTEYFSCSATVGNENGAETDTAGQTVESTNIAFTVRWCSETAAITSTGYRIIWNGELYGIAYVDHMNNKRKSLKLWGKKARR